MDIKEDKPLLFNIILWITCHITAQTCYYTCIIVLNTLVGDLYYNTLGKTN